MFRKIELSPGRHQGNSGNSFKDCKRHTASMIPPKHMAIHIDCDMPIHAFFQISTRIQCSFWSCARRIHSAENLDCLHHHLRSDMARRRFRFEVRRRWLRSELQEFLAIWTTGIKQKLQTWVMGTNWFCHDLSWSVRSLDLTSSCCVSWKVSTISQVYFHSHQTHRSESKLWTCCFQQLQAFLRSSQLRLKDCPAQKTDRLWEVWNQHRNMSTWDSSCHAKKRMTGFWGSATHKQFEGGFSVVLSITHSNLPVCIWKAITHLSQTQNVSGIKTSEFRQFQVGFDYPKVYIYLSYIYIFQISLIKTLVGFIKSHMSKWVEPCPACKHRSQGLRPVRPSSWAGQPFKNITSSH